MTPLVEFAKRNVHFSDPAFIVLLLIAGAILLVARPRWGRAWFLVAAGAYWIASTPVGARLISAPLAHGLTRIERASEVPDAAAIVVLGAGIFEAKDDGELLAYPSDHTAQRIVEGARVFRALGSRLPVVASGGRPRDEQTRPEGTVIADGLKSLGVPADLIMTDVDSLTTHDEAIIVTRMLRARGIDRFVLVTSPTHMRRSLAVFRAQGAEVVGSVAPWLSDAEPLPPWFVPNSASLHESDTAVYDYFGTVYYWLRGWFNPVSAS